MQSWDQSVHQSVDERLTSSCKLLLASLGQIVLNEFVILIQLQVIHIIG